MIEFFNEVLTFLFSGIYDLVVEIWSWVIIKFMVFKIEFEIFMVGFAWDVAKEILASFDISSEISNTLSALPDSTVSHLNYFNVINGINLILNAFVTRFVMRFIGI